MDAKTVDFSQTTITELMVPANANFSGKVHGGILLSLMDKVAYACAAKHAASYCVTVSVDGVEFREPVEVGELVSLSASINHVGNTSMIVGIRVTTLKPETGKEKHTNSCYFTMVAKDEHGKTRQVPKLILEDDDDIRRFYDAMMLKMHRSKIREILGQEEKSLSRTELLDYIDGGRFILNFDGMTISD